jgi:hypothetical protein
VRARRRFHFAGVTCLSSATKVCEIIAFLVVNLGYLLFLWDLLVLVGGD